MRVIEAGTAQEALEHLRAGNPGDFVSANIELLGSMNGIELADRVETDFPDLKLLMTPGRVRTRKVVAIGPFIPKPYDTAELIDRIHAGVPAQV